MITEEEKEELLALAEERILLKLPEVIGNLMVNHVALSRINRDFYKKYPEFRDKKDIVASVVESVEGENTLEDYEEILNKAIPKIRERIKHTENLNLKDVKRPDRNYHGEL